MRRRCAYVCKSVRVRVDAYVRVDVAPAHVHVHLGFEYMYVNFLDDNMHEIQLHVCQIHMHSNSNRRSQH